MALRWAKKKPRQRKLFMAGIMRMNSQFQQRSKPILHSLNNRGEANEETWNQLIASYKLQHPELGTELAQVIDGSFVIDAADILTFDTSKTVSTRVASGQAINHFVQSIPSIFGGSADLSHSTMTDISGEQVFAVESYAGRNIYFGVREHAMGAAGNGMALHGGVKPFVSTFFVFSDYLRPSIRLAAIQKLPVTYVFTHDSIAVGENLTRWGVGHSARIPAHARTDGLLSIANVDITDSDTSAAVAFIACCGSPAVVRVPCCL